MIKRGYTTWLLGFIASDNKKNYEAKISIHTWKSPKNHWLEKKKPVHISMAKTGRAKHLNFQTTASRGCLSQGGAPKLPILDNFRIEASMVTWGSILGNPYTYISNYG